MLSSRCTDATSPIFAILPNTAFHCRNGGARRRITVDLASETATAPFLRSEKKSHNYLKIKDLTAMTTCRHLRFFRRRRFGMKSASLVDPARGRNCASEQQ